MDILFVGNSVSYRGNGGSRELSPYGMFGDMAAAGGHSITLDASWIGGSALETHWLDTTGDQARQMLATGGFDLVVLQGTLTNIPDSNTGHSAENFDIYADLFAELAAANGTESVFMPSWTPDYLTSISGGDLYANETHTSNEAAALRNDGFYAPVSLAFEEAHTQLTARYGGGDDGQTAEELLTDGQVHANDLGAYLAAAVLYSTIFNEAPPTSWVPAGITGADAALMRQIAWNSVRDDGIAVTTDVTPPVTPPETGDGIIDGRYFFDTNGDGRNNNEPGVSGQTVTLLDSEGNVVDTAISANSGWYRFTDLAAGDYRVVFERSAGEDFIINTPGTGGDTFSDIVSLRGSGDGITGVISIGGDERRDRVDAGLGNESSPPPGGNGIIDGRYFDDTNGDGRNNGEPGVSGQLITLLDSDGDVVDTAISANSGWYRFEGLAAGDYRVVFEQSAGEDFILNTPGIGGDSLSDIVGLRGSGDGITGVISIGSNERRDRVDAGLGESAPMDDGTRPEQSDATILGSNGGNTIFGTGGGDIIFALGGNDTIEARSGDDFINGGTGVDLLRGQNGDDTFVFDEADSRVDGGNGLDRLVFNAGNQDVSDSDIRSVEIFDLSENGVANTLLISEVQLRQARDGELVILAGNNDTVRVDSRFDITSTGSTTIDGDVFDTYLVGENSWASTFVISDGATLDIL